MPTLSARDVVHAWESGRDRHPIDRALILLAVADPDAPPEALSALTVGQRNGRLLALRRDLLGRTLNGYAECPSCGQALEFSIDANAILHPEPSETTFAVSVDGFDLRVRLPDSRDLSAVVGIDDASAARHLLIDRCVVSVCHAGALPDTLLPALAGAMTDHDPQAEIHFRLTCQACGHSWPALFDIISFFWTEIEAYVRRLLMETHTLARAYGWSEGQILTLSSARRKLYLDMVGS